MEAATEHWERMAKDKIAQKKRYDALSPNSKKLKNQRRSENRRLKKQKVETSQQKSWNFILLMSVFV